MRTDEFVVVPLDEDFPEDAEDCLRMYVWDEGDDGPLLLEVTGNKNIKLVGKYYYRYDPSGMAAQGDWHLFHNGSEIAAWDSGGKARHGFAPGTTIAEAAKWEREAEAEIASHFEACNAMLCDLPVQPMPQNRSLRSRDRSLHWEESE